MESIAIAYVLNKKREQLNSLSSKDNKEKEIIERDIAKLEKLYNEALEQY